MLFVVMNIAGIEFLVVSAHGPHRAHSADTICMWWEKFRQLLQKIQLQRRTLLFLDANAHVGPFDPWVGDIVEDEFDTAGQALLSICRDFSLCIPSTFPSIHHGSTGTWQGPGDTDSHTRIDYICSSWDSNLTWLDTWMDANLDPGHSKMDHIPLYGRLIFQHGAAVPHSNVPRFDRERIAAATPEDWQSFFSDWPHIPWNTPPTEHALITEQHLHRKLQEVFPHKPQHRKDSFFSEQTWEIYARRNFLKKELKRFRRSLDCVQLRQAWCGLRGGSFSKAPILSCLLRGAGRYKQLKELSIQLHRHIAQDRLKKIDDITKDVQACRPKDVAKFLRPLRIGKRQRSIGQKQLPMINLEDGTIAATREESQARWRRHFSEMEAGELSTLQELYTQHLDSYGTSEVAFSDIPTIYELEFQMRRAKPRKAMGYDYLPGELLREAPGQMSYHLYPLVQKIALWQMEPLQFKGGRLATLFKKGLSTEAENYRAILVSSSLGKCFHNLWRKRSLPWMRAMADPMQLSATSGALVAQAAHVIRLHLGHGKANGVSCFAVFLDIQSAYYRLLRQHSMDLDLSDLGIMTLIHRLGLHDLDFDAVAKALQEPSTLSQIDCPGHLHCMISLFHSQTWFILADDDRLVTTHRGTRPGDGFADVVWNLTYSKFLHRVSVRLAATGAYQPLPWNGLSGLLCSKGDQMVQYFTTTWADDTAVMGWSPNATSVVPTVQVTTEVLYEELMKLGMQPNTKPGKTEAIVDIRGKCSVPCRQHLHHGLKGRIPLRFSEPGLEAIRTVPFYYHLGGMVVHGSRHLTEIKRRIAMTLTSITTHKTKIFANPRVDLAQRVSIFRATAFLTLTYNIGTWLQLTQAEQQAWHSGVMKVYRKLLSKLFSSAQQFTFDDGRILAMTGLPHPDDLLHYERLRHFGLVFRRPNDVFWALVANEETWLVLIRHSFAWLYRQLEGLTSLPDPSLSPETWHSLIWDMPQRWKGTLKRALAHATGQREIQTYVKIFHKDFFQTLEGAGLVCQGARTIQTLDPHTCLLCNKTFATFKAWAVHSFDAHQRVNKFRQLDTGSLCRACGKDFVTNSRLVLHFRSSRQCASTVAAQRSWTEPQPFMGSSSVQSTMLADSMKPWIQTATDILPPRHGTPMTSAQLALMTLMASIDWDTLQDTHCAFERIKEFAHAHPVHLSEIREVVVAFTHFHQDMTAHAHLDALLRQARTWFITEDSEQFSQDEWTTAQQQRYIDFPDLCTFERRAPSPRKSPKMLYVLHLFSGVKRTGDFHSYIDALSDKFSGIFCPISVDIALHATHGDLLRLQTQLFWLQCAADGKIFFVLCGPPCESWSASRMRYLEDGTGPRPIRESTPTSLLWGKAQLTLREIKQISFANRLLQFALLMMSRQLITGNFGILEHPGLAAPRQGLQPPSIWLLPCMQVILQHSGARLLDIHQGFYNAISPKPTTFLCVADQYHADLIEEALTCSRIRMSLPPALRMGRREDGTFTTNPLKRYPPALCAGLAKVVGVCVSDDRIASLNTTSDDGITAIAAALQKGYDEVKDSTLSDDAADFATDARDGCADHSSNPLGCHSLPPFDHQDSFVGHGISSSSHGM